MTTPSGYSNQTFTIEIEVTGSLDGVTFGPSSLESPADNEDPQQLYRSTQENLGLIDIDTVVEAAGLGRQGTNGHRYLAFIWIEGPTPAGGGAVIDVVDAVDGTPTQQKLIANPVGATDFYHEAVFLPQGSVLRVNGFTATGTPVKVRIGFTFAANPETIMLAQRAQCACETAAAAGDGFSRDTFSFSADIGLDSEAGSDNFCIWSSNTTDNTAAFTGNLALGSSLTDTFGLEKIATRAGRFSRIAVRSSVAIPSFNLFVDINGVRTIVVSGAAIVGGATIVFDIEGGAHVFPSTGILRVGITNTGIVLVTTDLNMDVELRYP